MVKGRIYSICAGIKQRNIATKEIYIIDTRPKTNAIVTIE